MVKLSELTAISPKMDAASEAFYERAVLDNMSIKPAIGDLLGQPMAIGDLFGQPMGIGDLFGQPMGIGDLLGQPMGIGDLLRQPMGIGDLLGEPMGIGDLLGQPMAIGDLLEQPMGIGDLFGQPMAIGDLLGEPMGIGDLLGQPMGIGDLLGQPMGIGDLLGQPMGIGDLLGQPMGIGDLFGQPMGIGDLLGEPMGIGDLLGEPMGIGDLFGQPMGIGDLLGEPMGIGDLLRQPIGIGDLLGEPMGIGDLLGPITLPSIVAREPVTTQYPSPEDEQGDWAGYQSPTIREERSLENGLLRVEPGLLNLLQGARLALSTPNPDRPRHVIVSLRELVTHVLHLLALDARIQNWNSDPDCYHNGRPTRRTRLLYIYRNINSGPLSKSVGAHVTWALTLMDELNAESHAITSRLTEQELQVLVVETESLLYSIIGKFFLGQNRTTPPL